MNEYNLESQMAPPQSVVVEEEKIEPIIPPRFIFEEVLQLASIINSKYENGRHKLAGRQLAGRVKDMHNALMAYNETIAKAADLKKGQTREDGLRKVMLTVRQIGTNLMAQLHQAMNDTTQNLERLHMIPKQALPPGMEPGIVSLIQCGLLQAPKKPGAEMWKLPDPIINALGIRNKLPSPYDELRQEQQVIMELSLKTLERLQPFFQKMQHWKHGDEHQGTEGE